MIFAKHSLDPEVSFWGHKLWEVTPVEKVGGVWFKREDYFAPLGLGGINGAKLRQCIWLTGQHQAEHPRNRWMVTGASVKSPQLSMGTAVARHFGLQSLLVVGATTPTSAVRHENVKVAAWLGAKFDIIPVAYNPQLQQRVRQHLQGMPDAFHLEYGISLDHKTETPQRVEAFHSLGACQVANLPPDVRTLVLPAGSCNTCVSVLYGIAKFRPNLERIILIGIGPNRLQFIDERLAAIETATGLQIRSLYRRDYRDNQELGAEQNAANPGGVYELFHYDLHSTGVVAYQQEVPFSFGGIDFHPTYEGKVMSYLASRREEFSDFWSGRGMLWIVGGRPTAAAMIRTLRTFGPQPTRVRLYP